MIIDSYAINSSARRSYQKLEATSLAVTAGAPQDEVAANSSAVVNSIGEGGARQDDASYSKGYADGLRARTRHVSGLNTRMPSSAMELKLQILDSVLFSLTGRRVSMNLWEGGFENTGRPGITLAGGGGGRGLTISHRQMSYERETVDYNTQGLIKTADGKTISVDISMHMSREFLQYSSTTLQTGGDAIDPLVINYGGSAASLTERKFEFDLDFDGEMDSISFAGPGSGFLALDKNGDGTINDGSELFGPGTGNGFGELRAHDGDGNGWIDEADEVFQHLRVWSKDENGKDQLFTLKELGIGAIYLGDVKTEFTMTDAAGAGQGVMRSTSFFLKEDGGAGTVSHIDLLV